MKFLPFLEKMAKVDLLRLLAKQEVALSVSVGKKTNYELLEALSLSLKNCVTYEEKNSYLKVEVKKRGISAPSIRDKDAKTIFFSLCLIVMGQDHLIVDQTLACYLESLELFFSSIGGVLGYQCSVLRLLEKGEEQEEKEGVEFPKGYDLKKESEQTQAFVLKAIKEQASLCELFPIGGAADRLNAGASQTIASANFYFFGKTLLTRLVEDVQCQEYLHFKLFKAQVITPLFFMASEHKEHTSQIKQQIKENHFFSRPESSITIGLQPLVPLFDQQGLWCTLSSGSLDKKPGGHGMLWKVAKEAKWIASMLKQNKRKMIVRQINNPLANTDYTLLAFQGLGLALNSDFGIAGCSRQEGAKEGICVITTSGNKRCLTNIEYCEKEVKTIVDSHDKGGSEPEILANTNILFADIKAVDELITKHPFPGQIVNFRSSHAHGKKVARLETMMQNISEGFLFKKGDTSRVFLSHSERQKTISCTKKLGDASREIELETPERAVHDMMDNHRDLLENYCGSFVPEKRLCNLNFLFSYHPSLGPLYSIIGQKIKALHMGEGSVVFLEIADLCLSKAHVEGALHVLASNVMGEVDSSGVLRYSNKTGQCLLHDVFIVNQGGGIQQGTSYHREENLKSEGLEIILEGHSRFIAHGVRFEGSMRIVVPEGVQMRAFNDEAGSLLFETEAIDEAPFYEYSVGEGDAIVLERAGVLVS